MYGLLLLLEELGTEGELLLLGADELLGVVALETELLGVGVEESGLDDEVTGFKEEHEANANDAKAEIRRTGFLIFFLAPVLPVILGLKPLSFNTFNKLKGASI